MASSDDNRPLPEDLAVEILLRLPVASLLRFKCVCKEWDKIINSPAFIRGWSRPPKILVFDHSGCPPCADSPPNPNPITLISTWDGTHECPDYMHEFRGISYLLGSVDGLFLLERVVETVYDIRQSLWNPATREVRHLPDPNFEFPPSLSGNIRHQYGFGLDPKTNDYKVVWFRFLRDKKGFLVKPIYGAVYSCSRDSWRMVHPEIHGSFETWSVRDSLCTTYLNGVYYWLMISLSSCKSKFDILSFDFGNEVFEEITGPEDVYSEHINVEKLILFDGSLALLKQVRLELNYDIWVMMKPGVWNKLVNFQCFGSCRSIRSWNCTTVIFHSKDYYLVSYDVRTQETRYLGSSCFPGVRGWGGLRGWGGSSVHFYKESLVPIKRNEKA